MSDRELLIEEMKQLPEPLVAELLDFLRFLKTKDVQDRFQTGRVAHPSRYAGMGGLAMMDCG